MMIRTYELAKMIGNATCRGQSYTSADMLNGLLQDLFASNGRKIGV